MIRGAVAGDAAALAALNRVVHDLHVAAEPAVYRVPTTEEVVAHVAGLLGDPEVSILIAEDDGAPAGYAIARRVVRGGHVLVHARRVMVVDQLAVRVEARRRGHARALMEAIELEAQVTGCVEIELDVRGFNDGARRFYEALGYAVRAVRMGREIP